MTHFCIVGEVKCGTTSLYGHLFEHPEVVLSETKEINYFISALHDWKNEKKLRNQLRHFYFEACAHSSALRRIVRKRYLRICKRKSGFVSGDGSVNYFSTVGMARRLKIYLPEVKLILILRNPVNRIYSNFWMNYRQGASRRYSSFEEFIDNDGWYRPQNLYAENLRKWLTYFPLEQFFLIKSEHFFEYPQEVLNELFEFLGVAKYSIKRRIHETPVAEKSGQYPPMKEQTRERLVHLLSYQQYHLLELTDKDFGWFSN